MTDMRVKRFLKKFVQTLIAVYSGVGEWLDILWCSVCLCLTFVTFFVKKYFLAHINFNKVYFKFILFLSVAALRVCVEDRHLFTESRRACTGEYRRFVSRGVYRRFAGSDIVRSVGRLSLVSFRFVAASVRVHPPESSYD